MKNMQLAKNNEDRTLAAQIYNQVLTWHRQEIRRFCWLARVTPADCRAHMLERARAEARQFKSTLRDWRLS